MEADIKKNIAQAMREDHIHHDITTNTLVSKNQISESVIVAREDCIVCGTDIVKYIFKILDPKIKLKFQATGTKIVTDSIFSGIKDVMTQLSDSLEGQLSNEVRNSIINQLDILREDSIIYAEKYDLFRVGKARIDWIEAPGSIGFEQFQDSIIRDFSIPVDLNRDTSTYYFYYHDLIDTLQLNYKREIVQTFDGVRMRLFDISINQELSTFDSVQIKCYKSECSNDLTNVFLYF